MQQIRVAVAAEPAAVFALVRRALEERSELVLGPVSRGEVELMLDAAAVDVVVTAAPAEPSPPAVVERLLDEYPRLGVVCLDVHHARGVVYQLGPQGTPLTDLAPHAVAQAIVAAADATTWKADDDR